MQDDDDKCIICKTVCISDKREEESCMGRHHKAIPYRRGAKLQV